MTADNAPPPTGAPPMFRPGFAPQNNNPRGVRLERKQPLGFPVRPVYIALALLPLIIAPYVLTLYIWLHLPQDDRHFVSTSVLDRIGEWTFAARAIDIFAALLSLPLVSSMLAHVAVIQSQRLKKAQSLSLKQLLSLADRSWMGLWPLTDHKGGPMLTLFGFASCFVMFLSFVNIPLRAILLQQQLRPVTICDNTSYDRPRDRTGRWYPECEPSPRLWSLPDRYYDSWTFNPHMITSNAVAREGSPAHAVMWYDERWSDGGEYLAGIVESLKTVTPLSWSSSPNLWFGSPRDGGDDGATISTNSTNTWQSAAPRGVSTGVLRLHSLGLSSTAHCQIIERQEFPEACLELGPPGFLSNLTTPDLDLRACIVEHTVPRFEPHRDRQTIKESLYLRMWAESEAALGIGLGDLYVDSVARRNLLVGDDLSYNKTVRCDAVSTMGYFELPGKHNNGQASPILDKWPSPDEMKDFDDFDENGNPMTREAAPTDDPSPRQGPMRAVAEALFGEASYFYRLAHLHQYLNDNNVPRGLLMPDPLPFSAMEFDRSEGGMSYFKDLPWDWTFDKTADDLRVSKFAFVAYGIISGFSHPEIGDRALHTALNLVNQASLTTPNPRSNRWTGTGLEGGLRVIYDKRQISAYLPAISLPVLIVLGVLVLIQVLMILGFLWEVRRVPTWTNTLDAYAMVRVGAQLESLPPLGRSRDWKADEAKVKGMDGLIGVESDDSADDIELAPVPSAMAQSGASSTTLQQQQQRPIEPPGPPAPSYESTIATDEEGGSRPAPMHRRVGVEEFDDEQRPSSPPPEYARRAAYVPPYVLSLGGKGLISRERWKKGQFARRLPG